MDYFLAFVYSYNRRKIRFKKKTNKVLRKLGGFPFTFFISVSLWTWSLHLFIEILRLLHQIVHFMTEVQYLNKTGALKLHMLFTNTVRSGMPSTTRYMDSEFFALTVSK